MEPKHAPEPGHNKYTRLAGNTMIFAISSFSSKLLTLIVQPFLTYAMRDVQSMGVSKLLSQCANLLIPLVSMGMSNAIIRFGLDKGNSKKQVFTNGLLTILLGYGVLLLCWPLLSLAPGIGDYGVFLCIYVLTSCLRTLCTQFIRSRQLNRLVGIDGVLCTFATLMFYVLYLVVLDMGAEGYLLAIICGDVTSSLFLFCTGKLWRYIDFRFINRALWREMLRFSLPMIPAQISFWIINASDMFFVNAMCEGYGGRTGPEWSGLLSTGYFLPTILNTLGTIFYDAWQLSAVTEEKGRSHFFFQLLRRMAVRPLPDPGGGVHLLYPVHEQHLRGLQALHPQPVHHDGGGGGQLRDELSGHPLVWPGGGHLRFFPGHGAGVRAARGGQPAADPAAAAPGAHDGERGFPGHRGGRHPGGGPLLRPVDRASVRGGHPVQLRRRVGHGPGLPRVLGRRAAPLVAWVDGVVAKVYH